MIWSLIPGPIRRALMAAGALIVAGLAIFTAGRRKGSKAATERIDRQLEKDSERTKERIDATVRRLDGDTADESVERLRQRQAERGGGL